MSRVAILGASGRLGHRLVSRALDLGFHVNALARDPSKLHFHHEHVTIIRGDASTGEGLEAAVTGCRNVVSTIDSHQPVIALCLANVVQAMESRAMLGRLIFISCAAVGQMLGETPSGIFRKLVNAPRKSHSEDLAAAESLLSVSGLDYTVLRATPLTDDLKQQVVVTVPHTAPQPGHISRASLAEFVLGLVNQPEWTLGEVTIGARPATLIPR